MNRNLKTITILLIILCSVITTGATQVTKTPQKVYRVYLKGESLGLIKSKKKNKYKICSFCIYVI